MLLALCFYRPIVDFFISPLDTGKIKTEIITQSRITNIGHSSISYYVQDEGKFVTLDPDQSVTVTQSHPQKLAIFSPAEGLTTILKVSLWVGMAGSAPIWLYWIYLFVAPALRSTEKRMFVPFALFSLFFSLLGLGFCYTITIPFANQYLEGFNAGLGQNIWGLSHYLNYSLILLSANAIAFESCVILLFLVHYGKVSDIAMRKYRPVAIVTIFILSAILTPPDVFTQLMMALPLMGFYELGILYARFKKRPRVMNKILD